MLTAVMIVVAGLLFAPSASTAQGPTVHRSETMRTPDEARPYLGVWTSLVEGPSGPITFRIDVTVREGKVVAMVRSDLVGEHEVDDITHADNRIELRYTTQLWGYSSRVVIILVPRGEQLAADFSIMNGQFLFSGLLTRTQATGRLF